MILAAFQRSHFGSEGGSSSLRTEAHYIAVENGSPWNYAQGLFWASIRLAGAELLRTADCSAVGV